MVRENGRRNQVVLSVGRKLRIHRFRARNPSNVGSSEWIENLLQFMQDPNIQINDIHRWVTNHKWIVAPVDQAQIETHEQSTSNAFLLPTQHQNPHDHSRNIQNEHFMDGSNSILNTGGNNGIFQNVPEHGFGFGFCQNAPICSTSTCGGLQPQQLFSPLGGTGNNQTPPVQEHFETPLKTSKRGKNVPSCDLLCTMLKAGEDLAKMKYVKNYRGLVKQYEKFYDHVYEAVKSSVLPKLDSSKVMKYETVTIEDNENERVTVENKQVQDVQDKDPLQI